MDRSKAVPKRIDREPHSEPSRRAVRFPRGHGGGGPRRRAGRGRRRAPSRRPRHGLARPPAATRSRPTPSCARCCARSTRAHRGHRRALVAFGTRHTLSTQADPHRGIGAARDWIFAEMPRYAARSGGRMTVELQSYVQPPASRIPTRHARSPTSSRRCRAPSTPDRIYVVSGHYDSRVTDVMNATSDAPGADDDASGVAVVDGAGPGDGHAPARGDHRLRRGRRRGAGPLRLDVHGQPAQGRRRRRPGHVHQRHRRQQHAPTTARRDPHQRAALRRGRADRPRRQRRPPIRQSVGGENDSPARQLAPFVARGRRQPAPPAWTSGSIYRRDRYLRGGDHIPFLQQGYPGRPVHRAERELRPPAPGRPGRERRAVRRPAASSATSTTSPAWPGSTPPPCGRWPRRRARRRTCRSTPRQLTNDTDAALGRAAPDADLAGYEVVWRPTTEPDWTHVIAGRRRHHGDDRPVEGQRVLRRPRRDRAGLPQPGGVPRPVVLTRRGVDSPMTCGPFSSRPQLRTRCA